MQALKIQNRMTAMSRPSQGWPEISGLTDLRIGHSTLAAFTPQLGGWRDNTLSRADGTGRFRVGRVARGITATRSLYQFRTPVRASITRDMPEVLLVLGLAGRSAFGVADQSFRMVLPGDVWLFRTGDVPVMRQTPAGACAEMFVLKFQASRLDGLETLSGPDMFARCLAHKAPVRTFARDVCSNELKDILDRLRAESFALDLLSHFLAPLQRALVPPDASVSQDEQKALARVMERLRSDVVNPPSLVQLATLAGMSHVRLNRLFRQVYGKTVFHWLRDYRLELAESLLVGKADCSITEIAFACGFSSSAHFAAAFRAHFGCTPQTFRTHQGKFR